MRGERIIKQLEKFPSGISKRDLKKRFSTRYRQKQFDAQFAYLLKNGVIREFEAGRAKQVLLARPNTMPVASFKEGDQVRIVRGYPTGDHEAAKAIGWDNVWVSEMDAAIGDVGVVISAHPTLNDYTVLVQGVGTWGYPAQSLESVTKTKADFPAGTRVRINSFSGRRGQTGTVVFDPRRTIYLSVKLDKNDYSGDFNGAPFEAMELDILTPADPAYWAKPKWETVPDAPGDSR